MPQRKCLVYKLYVNKIDYQYLRNDDLKQQQKSDLYLKYWWRYSTLKIPHFKGMDNRVIGLIPLFPYCAVKHDTSTARSHPSQHLPRNRRTAWGCCRSFCTCGTFVQTWGENKSVLFFNQKILLNSSLKVITSKERNFHWYFWK